jgi:hypothetical protein
MIKDSTTSLTITIYKWEGFWVFDDERVGLVKEGLINGTDLIIDRLVKDIPEAHLGTDLTFSTQPFPGWEIDLSWSSAEESSEGGNWYYCWEYNMYGWLCPSLYLYFTDTPKRLYIKATPRNSS